ncbi:hypothetical protein JCM10213_002632 [Rhodosporidiobolus nylandii]
MLDRLAIELLEQILRFAAPLDYTPELYEERRATIRSLCLVSRRTRQVAQPMLPEVFRAGRTEEHVEALETGGRGRQVKVLIYIGQYICEEEAGWLHRTLAACPRVRDLRFLHTVFDLKWLEPLSELRRVLLYCGRIHLTNAETTLPQLEELSMTETSSEPEDLHLMLRSHCLPALQSLAMEGFGVYSGSDMAAISSALSSDFLDGTKVFVLNADDLIAFQLSSFHTWTRPAVTLQSVLGYPEWPSRIRPFLPALSEHNTVRNLGVPDFLHPSRTLPAELASFRGELLKACADNKIRVVWTAELTGWDSMFPQEFRAVLGDQALTEKETERQA